MKGAKDSAGSEKPPAQAPERKKADQNRRLSEFRRWMWNFVLLHTVTYLVFGIAFMFASSYFDYFEADPLLSLIMRPADSIWVQLAVPFQLLRGSLLAMALFPLREGILEKKNGWMNLFLVMWVLTGIGAVITGPGSIEGFLYTNFGFGNPLIGLPEVTLQMMVFSYLFVRKMKGEKLFPTFGKGKVLPTH